MALQYCTACMSALLSPTPSHMFSVCHTHCRSEWLYLWGIYRQLHLRSHVLLSKLSASSSPDSPTVWHAKKRGDQTISVTSISLQLTHTRPKEEEEEEKLLRALPARLTSSTCAAAPAAGPSPSGRRNTHVSGWAYRVRVHSARSFKARRPLCRNRSAAQQDVSESEHSSPFYSIRSNAKLINSVHGAPPHMSWLAPQ